MILNLNLHGLNIETMKQQARRLAITHAILNNSPYQDLHLITTLPLKDVLLIKHPGHNTIITQVIQRSTH